MLSQWVSGVPNYLFNVKPRMFYKYMTCLLIHVNYMRFLRFENHDHPFSPFTFYYPPENSPVGIYFQVDSNYINDKCFNLYFKEIIDPVVNYSYKVMQGIVPPDFTKFVDVHYSHLKTKPFYPSPDDENLFNCQCFACNNSYLKYSVQLSTC